MAEKVRAEAYEKLSGISAGVPGLDELRARHTKSTPQGRHSKSVSSLARAAPVEQKALESVHSGLVQSLEKDCAKQRTEIKSLRAALRKAEEGAPSEKRQSEQERLAEELHEVTRQLTVSQEQNRALQSEQSGLQRQARDP